MANQLIIPNTDNEHLRYLECGETTQLRKLYAHRLQNYEFLPNLCNIAKFLIVVEDKTMDKVETYAVDLALMPGFAVTRTPGADNTHSYRIKSSISFYPQLKQYSGYLTEIFRNISQDMVLEFSGHLNLTDFNICGHGSIRYRTDDPVLIGRLSSMTFEIIGYHPTIFYHEIVDPVPMIIEMRKPNTRRAEADPTTNALAVEAFSTYSSRRSISAFYINMETLEWKLFRFIVDPTDVTACGFLFGKFSNKEVIKEVMLGLGQATPKLEIPLGFDIDKTVTVNQYHESLFAIIGDLKKGVNNIHPSTDNIPLVTITDEGVTELNFVNDLSNPERIYPWIDISEVHTKKYITTPNHFMYFWYNDCTPAFYYKELITQLQYSSLAAVQPPRRGGDI